MGRPPDDAVLKYEVIVDPRFSTGGFTHSEILDPTCPTRLHVTGSVSAHGTFKGRRAAVVGKHRNAATTAALLRQRCPTPTLDRRPKTGRLAFREHFVPCV
jgi:hypothetical protein